jgi:uncharacterized membrane protein YkoI
MRRTTHALSLAATAALVAIAARTAPAQPIRGSAALKARAKVSGDSAMRVARHEVPNGKIKSGEIEEEKGALIYSFDIVVPGKSGIEEVNVDARTGAVVAHEHESAAAEHAEAKAEHAKQKAAKKTP